MKKLEEYCELDLYDKYVDFKKKYATEVLSYRKDYESRKCFTRYFHIYDRKKFWQWFDGLHLGHQEELRANWEMGYEEYVRRDLEKLDEDLASIEKEIEEIGEEEWLMRLRFSEDYGEEFD